MSLYYHRVADKSSQRLDDLDRAVQGSRSTGCASAFDLVSLVEAQQRMGSPGNRTAAVCITFDDGYADNCREAIPWLLDERVPFTYFVSTSHVLEGRPFEHDLQRGCPAGAQYAGADFAKWPTPASSSASHTRDHVDLGPGLRRRTALQRDRRLETRLGSRSPVGPCRYFAFPFGLHANLSQAAFAIGVPRRLLGRLLGLRRLQPAGRRSVPHSPHSRRSALVAILQLDDRRSAASFGGYRGLMRATSRSRG